MKVQYMLGQKIRKHLRALNATLTNKQVVAISYAIQRKHDQPYLYKMLKVAEKGNNNLFNYYKLDNDSERRCHHFNHCDGVLDADGNMQPEPYITYIQGDIALYCDSFTIIA